MPDKNLVEIMADAYALQTSEFVKTVKATCFPPGPVTDEQLFLFLSVAREHQLNPFTREVYAFTQGGKVQIIVGVDGWAKIVNRHPAFDGMTFEDVMVGTGLTAITCNIFRKDRSHPTSSTEYLAECKRNTDPWNRYPKRMLRHKAMIQAARYAFGFAGIVDPDEAERVAESWSRPGGDNPPPITLSLDAPPIEQTQVADRLEAQTETMARKRGRPPKTQDPQAPAPIASTPPEAQPTCGFCHRPGHDFNSCPDNRAPANEETVIEPQITNGAPLLSEEQQAEVMRIAKSLRPKSAMTWLVALMEKDGRWGDVSEVPADDLGALVRLMQANA